MKTQKNLVVVTLTALLLSVSVGCSKEKKSSAYEQSHTPQKNAVCEGIQCMGSINWKIVLQGQDFPDKSRIDVNGITVLDECMGKQKYRIDRSASPQSLELENFLVPKPGHVKIHIVDQGWDCSHETTFLLNKEVQFDVVKSAGMREIRITL